MKPPVGNLLLQQDILLESGTNEVEILVFRVGSYRLGINVAKVREILPSQRITRIPHAHRSVLGCFRLRETVVPCVSLQRHLDQPEQASQQGNLILTEFNRCQIAFIVDAVERIHRISWEEISPVPSVMNEARSPVTAVVRLDGCLVSMLDFEFIAAEISQEDQTETVVENPSGIPREQARILIADDSQTVRFAVESTLRNSGYTQVRSFEHGGQVWDWLREELAAHPEGKAVAELLVCDVEMPSMDGFHLTQNIKQHPRLKQLPVVLYSSILTPDNLKKGRAVGADAQVTKPELARLVELADELAHAPANPVQQPQANEPQRGAPVGGLAPAPLPAAV